VNELSLGDREGEASGCRDTAERAVVALKELDVASMRGGRDCDHEIIHIGDYNAFRDHGVKWRNVYNEEEGRGSPGGYPR